MNSILRKAIFVLTALIGVVIFAYVCLTTFVRKYATEAGVTYDGLGRELVDTPAFLRVIGYEPTWVGFQYFAIDLAIFWGGVGLIMGLMIAERFEPPPNTDT